MPQLRVQVNNLIPLGAQMVSATLSKLVVVEFRLGESADGIFNRAREQVKVSGFVPLGGAADCMVCSLDQERGFYEAFPPDYTKLPDIPAWSKLMADQPL